MGVNKVDLNGETLVDLTGDTVAENNLLQGVTAHNAAGEQVEGAVTVPSLTNNLLATVPGVSALDAAVGPVIENKGSQISVYKGEDGILHFRDWNGADTGIPFSNNIKILNIRSLSYSTDITYSHPVYLHGICKSNATGNAVVYIDNESYINPSFDSLKLPSGTRIRGRGTNQGVYNVYMIEVDQ